MQGINANCCKALRITTGITSYYGAILMFNISQIDSLMKEYQYE